MKKWAWMLMVLVACSSAQAADVVLLWTAPGDDDTTGTAAIYDMRYTMTDSIFVDWASTVQAVNEPTPSIAGSSETMVITGLASQTAYWFAIKSRDEAGNESEISNIVKVITADETAPATIVDLRVGP